MASARVREWGIQVTADTWIRKAGQAVESWVRQACGLILLPFQVPTAPDSTATR